MKHYLRFLITMLLLVLFGGGSFGQTWQKVELKDLTSDDVFVIVDVTNSKAIQSTPTKSNPKAVPVSIVGDKLTGDISVDLMWNVKKYADGVNYTFYPNGKTDKCLAVKRIDDTNLVIDKNNNNKFKEYSFSNYVGLLEASTNRFVSYYSSSSDFRGYKSSNTSANYTTKLAYFKYVDETKTATNVTFGENEDGKTIDVTEGKESSFSGKTATEKDGVAGTIKYSSNNTSVVSVDESTGAVKFGKTFGTATITALFAPTDAAKYKESSASYTINYNKKERIATTLTFKETSGSVNIGETFTLPELTLKAGDEVLTGRTFTYSSSATGVASIGEKTGTVTIHSAGNTVLTAKFEDPEDKYESSTAEFTLKVIDPNAIVFSAADKSFDGLGAYDESDKKEVTKTFNSASGKSYSFTIFYCTKANSKKSDCLQMKSGNGYVTSPSFKAYFPYGYKVTVYYTAAEKHEDLTISSNPSLEVKSTTEKSGGGTADDPEYVTTISLPLSTATFTMTANSGVKYVSRIELTPLAAPEIETVTLDETTNNDKVVEDYAGKTVNVTLKRTISDTYLNPFCVPFDMTADQITAVFGEGSVVSAFTSVTGKVMNFEKVATITAGQPYIVQATKASTEISLDNVEMKLEPGSNVKQNSSELSMSFNGIVSPYTFKKNDGTELFLDKNGNLRYPSTVGSQMKGMRAYFEVLGGTGNEAKVNIGGGLSSIDKLMNGEAMTGKVYNLNGQYVGNTLDGLAKGLYIMNGKKYVVK
ncbi:Ig-like domain-containing protein [Prevotella sp.]|uniref:Ig-like domain-containing protein n=1 Tax=Prevotella sp. TaxID=59823 RepID=UPI0030768AF5